MSTAAMTDRELLELAAKAAGIELKWMTIVNGPQAGEVFCSNWHPLADDGDALRLAVRVPAVNLNWVLMEAWQAHDKEEDRRAYVRRVIVLAAAEFAKAMP